MDFFSLIVERFEPYNHVMDKVISLQHYAFFIRSFLFGPFQVPSSRAYVQRDGGRSQFCKEGTPPGRIQGAWA